MSYKKAEICKVHVVLLTVLACRVCNICIVLLDWPFTTTSHLLRRYGSNQYLTPQVPTSSHIHVPILHQIT